MSKKVVKALLFGLLVHCATSDNQCFATPKHIFIFIFILHEKNEDKCLSSLFIFKKNCIFIFIIVFVKLKNILPFSSSSSPKRPKKPIFRHFYEDFVKSDEIYRHSQKLSSSSSSFFTEIKNEDRVYPSSSRFPKLFFNFIVIFTEDEK